MSTGQDAANALTPEEEQLPSELLELLQAGRFAEYHLEKAKIALADRDFKTASYQVRASLCHNPQNADEAPRIRREGLELKREIRRQARAK